VIGMAERARTQAFVAHVVLRVRCGDDDGGRRGEPEHGALERAQPRWIDVFDHLHQHRHIQTGQPVVAVGQRRLEQFDAGTLQLAHPVELQPAGRDLQRPRRYVDGDNALDRLLGQQITDQDAFAAAEVADAAGAARPDRGEHRAAPLLVERCGPLLIGVDRDGVVERLRRSVVHLGQPGEGDRGQLAAVSEVAPGDQRAGRVGGEPGAAGPDQLVDLVVADPVMLRVVENRQQHV
jgi:hypothetical protein